MPARSYDTTAVMAFKAGTLNEGRGSEKFMPDVYYLGYIKVLNLDDIPVKGDLPTGYTGPMSTTEITAVFEVCTIAVIKLNARGFVDDIGQYRYRVSSLSIPFNITVLADALTRPPWLKEFLDKKNVHVIGGDYTPR